MKYSKPEGKTFNENTEREKREAKRWDEGKRSYQHDIQLNFPIMEGHASQIGRSHYTKMGNILKNFSEY